MFFWCQEEQDKLQLRGCHQIKRKQFEAKKNNKFQPNQFAELCEGKKSVPIDNPDNCPSQTVQSQSIRIDSFNSEKEVAICLNLEQPDNNPDVLEQRLRAGTIDTKNGVKVKPKDADDEGVIHKHVVEDRMESIPLNG